MLAKTHLAIALGMALILLKRQVKFYRDVVLAYMLGQEKVKAKIDNAAATVILTVCNYRQTWQYPFFAMALVLFRTLPNFYENTAVIIDYNPTHGGISTGILGQ